MSESLFEINASPEELADMERQISAAEAEEAASANNGERAPETEVKTEPEPEKTPEPETKPETSSSTPEASKEQEKKEPEPEQTVPKSAYGREMERRDKSWKALNEEKARFAEQQKALETQRQQFQAERDAAIAAQPEYTYEQYVEAAKKFEAAGEIDLANEAAAMAAHMKANPPEVVAIQRRQAARVNAGQNESWARILPGFPDVRKVGSPLNLKAVEITKSDPHFWNAHPNAPEVVTRMAHAQLQAARVPELEKGLATAKARIAELEKLTSIAPGGLPPARREITPQEDTEESLYQAARQADGYR